MSSSFCTGCGEPLAGQRFCSRCGLGAPAARLAAGSPERPAAPAAPQPVWSGNAPATRGRRTKVLAAAAAAVVLVGAGLTAVVVMQTSGDDRVSVLDEPGSTWHVDVDDVVPGGYFSAMTFADGEPPAELLAFDDVVVANVMSGDGDETESVLAGLDARTGDVLWTRSQDEVAPECHLDPEGEILLCGSGSTDTARSVVAIDPATGDDVARSTPSTEGSLTILTTPHGVFGLDGQYVDGAQPVLTAYDDDLDPRWTTTLDVSGMQPSEAYPELAETGDDLELVILDRTWRIRPSDGSVEEVWSDDSASYGTYDGLRVGGSPDGSSFTVRDEDGDEVFSAPGYPWTDHDGGGPVVDGTIGAGTTLYDVRSGDPIWERSDLDPEATYLTWWGGALLATSYDGSSTSTVSALDPGTGATRWSADQEVALVDDEAVVTRTVGEGSSQVTVRSARDGAEAWSADVSDLRSDDAYAAVTATRTTSAVVAAGNGGLRGWTDFGGSASGDAPDTDQSDQPDEPPLDQVDDSDEDGGTSYATECGTEPEFTPVSSTAADGSLTVTVLVTATGPGGQRLASSDTDITVLGPDGVVYASGLFDFSGAPLTLPDADDDTGSLTIPLSFPASTVYSTPTEVSSGVDGDQVLVECTQPASALDPDSGSDDDTTGETSGDTGDDGGTIVAPPTAPDGDPDEGGVAESPGAQGGRETALEALRRIAAEDYREVSDDLVGSWVPQLSSKLKGVNGADGYFDYEDILAEHQALRLTYPDVRLLYSSEWNYLVPDLWVTLTGLTYDDALPALDYCADQGFDKDHCYTKLLFEPGGPVDHTTWFLTSAGTVPRNGPPPVG